MPVVPPANTVARSLLHSDPFPVTVSSIHQLVCHLLLVSSPRGVPRCSLRRRRLVRPYTTSIFHLTLTTSFPSLRGRPDDSPMSHIPGFALGALGSNNPQQSQSSLPTNLNLFNPQQQQAILAQHQQSQQRQQQSSPHQSQIVPGVTDPEHQRMWQAMDQHVRAHNDAAQANPAFNQVCKSPASPILPVVALCGVRLFLNVPKSFVVPVGDRVMPPFFARVSLHPRFHRL